MSESTQHDSQDGRRQYGMVIDTGNCVGCQTCVISCKVSNAVPGDAWWNTVESKDGELVYQPTGRFPHTVLAFRPRLCNHCEKPLCVANCPSGAMHKDPETGIVAVNAQVCIGCGYCAWSCPYGAPAMDDEAHVMGKCNFCAPLLAEGSLPYCVAACPARARHFGVISDPGGPLRALIQKKHGEPYLPRFGTAPSVYYV
jgi:DMSO reductase iron-sulfur subunit